MDKSQLTMDFPICKDQHIITLQCLNESNQIVYTMTAQLALLQKYPFFLNMQTGVFKESKELTWKIAIPQIIECDKSSVVTGDAYKSALEIVINNKVPEDGASFLYALFVLDYIDGLSEIVQILSSVKDFSIFMNCVSYLLIWLYSSGSFIETPVLNWLKDLAIKLNYPQKLCQHDIDHRKILYGQVSMVMEVINCLVFELTVPLTNIVINDLLLSFLLVFRAADLRIPLNTLHRLETSCKPEMGTSLVNAKQVSTTKLSEVSAPFSDFYMNKMWKIVDKYSAGACIAGGAILHAVEPTIPTNDIDIFVYGNLKESFDLFKHLYTACYIQYKDKASFSDKRHHSVVTFTLEENPKKRNVSSIQIIWSGLTTLEETLLKFDLCFIQWAWDGHQTICTPEALMSLYTRLTTHTGYMSRHQKKRIEKAKSKGFHVQMNRLNVPLCPQAWWIRYPFFQQQESTLCEYHNRCETFSESEISFFNEECDQFYPMYHSILPLNFHGDINEGSTEFNPYKYYHHHHSHSTRSDNTKIYMTFCLDLVRLTKIWYNYIYCQIDETTFEKIYTEDILDHVLYHNSNKSRYLDSFCHAMELNCIDDQGLLVLPIFVNQTGICYATEASDKTDIIAENISPFAENHQPIDLSKWFTIGDDLSITVCVRKCNDRIKFHAVSIWVHEKNSKVIQSLQNLSDLKPKKMFIEEYSGIYHPLYEMNIPTHENKLGFYHLIKSMDFKIHCPPFYALDLIAYRGKYYHCSDHIHVPKSNWYLYVLNYLSRDSNYVPLPVMQRPVFAEDIFAQFLFNLFTVDPLPTEIQDKNMSFVQFKEIFESFCTKLN